MALVGKAPLVKLICGMISARKELLEESRRRLVDHFGPVDCASEVFPFDFTHYYDDQMGSPLLRQFVSFERVADPAALVEAKLATNALEEEFAQSCGSPPPRPVNLDPGYVEESKLVLASMKNFSHRIYVGRGVYEEITLMYRKGGWEALGWTFPDYASQRYHPFLLTARMLLRRQVHGKETPE